MQEMYEEVYVALVASGLAVIQVIGGMQKGKLLSKNKMLQDANQNMNIHPNQLVFVVEVGSSTSQTKDGKVGGEMYLCTKNGQPQKFAATKDSHFTVLGFTSANGEPLICQLHFAAKALRDEWVMGFDPFLECIGEDNEIEGQDFIMKQKKQW